MKDSVANRYALALFELAKENDEVKLFKQELNEFYSLLDNDSLIFLNHFSIPLKAKKDFLSKVFKEKMNKTVFNFICLLLDKNRFNIIEDIIKEFNEVSNQYLNIEEGIIYSAISLSEEDINKIAQKISKLINKQTYLTLKIDESLKAGFKVCINDKVFDNSIKNRLDNLRRDLLKEEVNS